MHGTEQAIDLMSWQHMPELVAVAA